MRRIILFLLSFILFGCEPPKDLHKSTEVKSDAGKVFVVSQSISANGNNPSSGTKKEISLSEKPNHAEEPLIFLLFTFGL